MADKDQTLGSIGIVQRWKEFVTGFYARLMAVMLYTPNGDSMADDTADALKTVGVAGTAIIGKVGIDQTTDGTTNAVNVKTTSGAGATIGTTAGAAVTTDADGTIQQYLRGLAKNFLAKIGFDNTDGLKVSMYGKRTAAGDTPLPLTSANRLAIVTSIGGSLSSSMTGQDNNQARVGVDGQSNGFILSTLPFAYNGASLDALTSIAASGAGVGVQRVGTLGELITLAASAARTESANGTAVTGLGWRNRYIILLDLTVADTDAGDTLDVYIDISPDSGTTWLNAVHFTQIVGTDSASKRYAVLDPSAPGTSEIVVTSDAAAGVVRPSMFGDQMRARWAIIDAGTDDASFTFSVSAYAI